jgi:hypothetical protein
VGSTWGPEGPPPEAYERITNPERFAPLLDIATDLLDRLESLFEVTREEGYGLDARLEREATRPTVRLIPRDPEAGELAVGFTKFPGIILRLGHWFVEPIPTCGCDACDETAEEGEKELNRVVSALTSGTLHERIRLPTVGDARHYTATTDQRGWGVVPRAQAQAWIEAAGGKSRFDYAPWPLRSQAPGATNA